jgi:CheY-like chemotaxis protein
MNLSIGGKIKLGFAVSVLVALIVSISFFHSSDRVKADNEWVTHTIGVLRLVESLNAQLTSAESAARGHEIAGGQAFRDRVVAAPAETAPIITELRSLIPDNPAQQKRLTELEPILARRFHELEILVDSQSSTPADKAARAQVLAGSGEAQTEQARRILTDMADDERQLLAERQARAKTAADGASGAVGLTMLFTILVIGVTGFLVTHSIAHPLENLRVGAERIGSGEYGHRVPVESRDEIGRLGAVFNRMAEQIERRQAALGDQDWLKTSLGKVARLVQGDHNINHVCQAILTEIASLVGAGHSIFHLREIVGGERILKPKAVYAMENPKSEIPAGEGLAGQCLRDGRRIMLEKIPLNYLRINSSLGAAPPSVLLLLPVLFAGEVRAVIELAAFQTFSDIQLQFLDQLADLLGTALNDIEASHRTVELLKETRVLADHLQTRQTELNGKNRELEAQAGQLRTSEQRLQEQQEELQQANEELQQANEELQHANVEMEEKAEQLARASEYKSEFLAGMSHELRTPLNSLLILSKILTDNAGNNLTAKQVEYASTIYSSGNDLLELINDILDLSKIESGSVEADLGDVQFFELAEFVEKTFRHVADQKRLEFRVSLAPELPDSFQTDSRRVRQILKNLLANAFKFTERGSVELRVRTAQDASIGESRLPNGSAFIAFDVIDTGIGIPKAKQQLIFEAFRQADSGTARRFGGTGLGLSISRQMAQMLGGSISVASDDGAGSTFTLYLPSIFPSRPPAPHSPLTVGIQPPHFRGPARMEPDADAPETSPDDDRHNIHPGDLTLLIVEDDRSFASIVIELAREKGLKAVAARTAAEALLLAPHLAPSVITLDLLLPDNDGWVILDRLKNDSRTRHIPVHVVSVADERDRCLRLGAASFLEKPVSRETLARALDDSIAFIRRPYKTLLIIEDDPVASHSIVELVGNGDVLTTVAASASEALAALDSQSFDCLVLDLGLPDMDGLALIREIQKRAGKFSPPIIVYTGRDLTREEETQLRQVSDSIIVKDVRSPERLLDETSLFLHRPQSKLPEPKRRMLEQARKNDPVLSGRTVLVVDDDVRNIFAIASALESCGTIVVHAESGQGAIDTLQSNAAVDAVLMDVMMPGMDGNETIRRIRRIPGLNKLPIISLTAKAMAGDREICLQAGASDYITKPVDLDQLKSLLRIWLYH